MRSNFYRYAWLFVILLSSTLACQLVSRIGQTKEKVEAAATEAKAGLNMLGTARALVTKVGSSEMLKTAQALATEVGESGLLQTAIAVATEEGPSAIATAKAFATQEGPALEATAKAFATQEGPSLQKTAQAAMTQAAGAMGEPPDDIPIVAGNVEDLLTGEFVVSYSVPMDIQDVASFYKREMPANGWKPVEQGTLVSESMVALNYEKTDRAAAVTITINPVNKKAIVFILISEK
jgi:hypothetical protein